MPPISFELATRVGFLACAGQKRDSSLSPSSHLPRWAGWRWRRGWTWRRCPCRFPVGPSRPGWVEPSARYSVAVECRVADAVVVVGARWVHAGPSLLLSVELGSGVETLSRAPATLESGGWLSQTVSAAAPLRRRKLGGPAAERWRRRLPESLGWSSSSMRTRKRSLRSWCCSAEWQGRTQRA